MVKSYNDPVKKLSRVKLREFIKDNLNVPLEKARVVCFPGAEIKGEEGLEIKEIYDPLGIPRENIVGLENNPKSAKRLEAANLGIDVIRCDALNYFERTDKSFDIINLDYTGQMTWKETDTTRNIVGRGIIDKFGIYCTNHFIKREGANMKRTFLEKIISQDPRRFVAFPNEGELNAEEEKSFWESQVQNYNTIVDFIEKDNLILDALRISITKKNISILQEGTLEVAPFYHLTKDVGDFTRGRTVPEEFYKKLKLRKIRGIEANPEYQYQLSKLNAFENQMIHELVTRGIVKDYARYLTRIQNIYVQNGKIIRNLKRYKYTSNKNARMLLDCFALAPPRYKLYQQATKIATFSIDKQKIILNPERYTTDKWLKMAKKVASEIEKDTTFEIVVPIDLGSSWVPPKRKEKISKEDAISLLGDGISPTEIVECYSGFSVGQLAAYKAHYVTMGKSFCK